MEELRDIIQQIKAGKITNPQQIKPFEKNRDGLMEALFEGIMADKFTSDEGARTALYGDSEEEGVKVRYSTLKTRLKERLRLSLLFSGKFDKGSYRYSFVQCHRDYIIGRLMLFFHAFNAGYNL